MPPRRPRRRSHTSSPPPPQPRPTSQPRPGPRSRRAVLGLGALAALGIGGAGLATHHLTSGNRNTAGGGGSDMHAQGRAEVSADAREFVDSLPDLDDRVPDLHTTDLQESTGLAITYASVPGARGLSEAVDICAGKLLRERRTRGENAHLALSSRVVISGSENLAVLLDVEDEEGPSAALVYYRSRDDRAFASPGLIDEGSWGALTTAVLEAAETVPGTDAHQLRALLREQPRPFGNGPALVPADDGRLLVLFPSADTDAGRGEVLLQVPASTAAELWNDNGGAILDAVRDGGSFDPGTVTIPEDTHDGDTAYGHVEGMDPGAVARTSDGTGPRTQLAPRTREDVRPSPVVAPDANLLRAVALTFDDGPDEALNAPLREQLTAHGVAATFFMIGTAIEASPEAVADTVADGHEVGGHSWSHPSLDQLATVDVDAQITDTTDALIDAGGRLPMVMRPPFGASNTTVDDVAGEHGLSVQIWDVDSLDWQTRDAQQDLENVQKYTQRGSIILMHEVHEATIESMTQVHPYLAEAGLCTLTCSEIGQNRMYAGKHYRHGYHYGEAGG